MIERDHAIGHVFFDALARQRPIAALAGDEGCDALYLQPAKQPPQFGPQDRLIVEPGEKRFNRVESDALGADRRNRVLQPNEQALEIIFAGFLDLAAFDGNIVHREQLPLDEIIEVEPQGSDVAFELLLVLLEAHEDAGFVVVARPAGDEFHGQLGLAAAGAAADQRSSAARKPAAGDLIEPGDAGCAFRDRHRWGAHTFSWGLGSDWSVLDCDRAPSPAAR